MSEAPDSTLAHLAEALDVTEAQARLLLMIDRWDGDLPPDAEDVLGAHGAAFDAILGGLLRRRHLAGGAWETFILGDEVLAALVTARGQAA